jgi:hypothetical protein
VLVVLIISLPAEHPGSVPFLGSERSQPVRAGSSKYGGPGPRYTHYAITSIMYVSGDPTFVCTFCLPPKRTIIIIVFF